jgi:membrane protease YdiL (CAAX protease family)
MADVSGAKRLWPLTPALREKLLLGLEFAGLFIGVPFVIVEVKSRVLMLGLLWVSAFVAYRATRHVPRIKHDLAHLAKDLKPIAIRFAVLAPIIAGLAWYFLPDSFLQLPRQAPALWIAVMFIYPLLSVWPQEMVYRAFIYNRYAPLFGQKWGYVAVSALAFGYVHMIFLNGIAIAMTAFGGLLFARDYARHKSLLLVCLEHALYGCLVFTVGLGRFFYSGAAWD